MQLLSFILLVCICLLLSSPGCYCAGVSLVCPVDTVGSAAQSATVGLPCCKSAASAAVTVTNNVVFGTAFNIVTRRDETLLLDTYRRSNIPLSTRIPAVVVVHGGGFMPTSTKQMDKTVQEATGYARLGFMVLSIEYRRYGGALRSPELMTHPAQDVLAAIRYVHTNAATLGIDTKNIGVYGSSAGGIAVVYALAGDVGTGTSTSNAGASTRVNAAAVCAGGFFDDDGISLRPCASVPPVLFMERLYPHPRRVQQCNIQTECVCVCVCVWAASRTTQLRRVRGHHGCPRLYGGWKRTGYRRK